MPAQVKQFAEIEHPKVRYVLTQLMNGDLYYVKATKQIVTREKDTDGSYKIWHGISKAALPNVKRSALKKVKTNNAIRKSIRGLLAQLDLTSPDKGVRLAAMQELLSKPSDETVTLVKKLSLKEQDEDVLSLMNSVIYVQQLSSADAALQLEAAKALQNSLEPSVKNALEKTLAATDIKNIELRKALETAISKIEQKRSIFSIIENLFFGLSLGSVLLLAAIGLAITFGVMGVINMAHGEMIMLGAYTTYVIQQVFPQWIEYSLFMAIPAAFLVSGFVGILIERGVIRHLKGRPLETLLATFGISLILQQLVRSVFSPLNRQVAAPEWMSGSWQINPIFSLTYNRLYIIVFALMVFVALLLILKKSSLGLHVRAVAQNRDMARSLSIKSDWVDAATFGLGSGIAGIAGVVLSQLTNVGPNLGQAYIIDSFLVVVFGGVGNLWGTLVAAMTLGTVNKFLEPVTGSVLASIIVLVGLVLFIQKRPKGLFPQKGRAAD
nr:urea ABC transporter permease subunit UrtB [Algibacillus agarilyticus]